MPFPAHSPRLALGRLLAAAVLVPATLGACRAVTAAYGADLAAARAHVDALASALEQRYTRPTRTPKFANARMRVARYAFAPSKLANDTALWTAMRSTRTGADRDLEIAALMTNGQYTFTARPNVGVPSRLGDSRHRIRLRQLTSDGDWLWDTEVAQAVGVMPPSRVTDVARALFASGERATSVVRADYLDAFPRTATALGRVFTVDSLITIAQGDGSTLVRVQITMNADGARREFPAFATFFRKYIEPAKYRFRLSDRGGGDWFDAQQSDRRLTIRYRAHGGELQPLLGAARRMPDSLLLNVDALDKVSFFTVGMSGLQGQFVHVHTASERSWAMRFIKEPAWHLPLIGERLLRSPLRRPFEGPGMEFRLGFRSSAEGQTLLTRTYTTAVRESAIMRFLGNLGFTAMSDYAASDADESRFIAEAMAALREDTRAH